MRTWIDVLQDECERTSQREVSKKLGYSATTISLVLNGTYKGDLNAVERAVKVKLTTNSVSCPILGQITAMDCSSHQSKPFSSSSSLRVKLFKACRKCPNNTKRRDCDV